MSIRALNDKRLRDASARRLEDDEQMAGESNAQAKRAPASAGAGARAKARSGEGGAARGSAGQALVRAELRRVEQVFADFEWAERRVLLQARKRARERALELVESAPEGIDVRRACAFVAATELLVGMQATLAETPYRAAELTLELEAASGMPAILLAREVLRAPELMAMPPAAAVEAQLTMLFALASLRSVSLWKLDNGEQATCVHHVGEGEPSRRARQLAQRMLAGEDEDADAGSSRALLFGARVGRWQQPLAAIVATAKPSSRERAQPFVADALPMLAAVLERELLISNNAAAERALVETSERKLTRLGFDLHDGPIQDVAMLAEDVRLFRDQLARLAAADPKGKLVRARFEDVEAQLVAIDSELRRLSGEVQAASALLNRPFKQALLENVRAFTTRTGVEPRVSLDGDLSLVSASQQIALLNIVHEALNNIREHAHASEVRISVAVDAEEVCAEISDNGTGFDLEATLVRTTREGRVGLVAMNERVRLLGGRCHIETSVGGPTTICVWLARWRPTLEHQPAGA